MTEASSGTGAAADAAGAAAGVAANPDVGAPPELAASGARTTKQWILLGLAVTVLVVGCVFAGRWQWNRHIDRAAAITIINENYAASPVPLTDVLPQAGAVVDTRDVWRPVSMHGHYVPEATVLLRNRPVDKQASFHILVPFVTDDGTVLVVNRGWLPYGRDSAEPDSVPAPPSGEVDVVVRLRADEPAATNGAPDGQVQAINTAQVLAAGPDGAAWAQGLTFGAYGALTSESPAPEQAVRPLPVPDTDPRSHLSYAFQWWVFALGGVGGFILLVVRERRELALAELGGMAHPFDPAESDGAGSPSASLRGGPRHPSQEEIEDSLIESRTGR